LIFSINIPLSISSHIEHQTATFLRLPPIFFFHQTARMDFREQKEQVVPFLLS